MTESFLSIYFTIKSKCKKVVMSCIYSQDSNINYLLFKHFNIEVIKNPSEDALAFDNQLLLTDGLIVCNPYQIEEITDLKYVKVKYLIHGIAEQSLDYYTKYEKYCPSESHVIGYYSSGSWLRKQQNMNYTHQGIDCAAQEEYLLLELKQFILQNSKVKLRIFLHPVEKRNKETINKVTNYIASILENVNYDFASFNTATCLNFEACNVAISLFSGSSMYRLNFGYKSLFYVPQDSFAYFPFLNSSLNKINLGKQPFNDFLLEVLELKEQEFFNKYQLEKYLFNNQMAILGQQQAA